MYDLHVHSRCSDGTDDPASLTGAVLGRGLSGFALTDHDTVAGLSAAQRSADRLGVDLVAAIELSASHEGTIIHVLGYFIDPTSAALARQFERLQERRIARSRTIVERLAADHPITWAAVRDAAGDIRTIGRPHIADALIASGAAVDRRTAFDTLLHERSPYVVPLEAPSVETTIATVTDAGGAAVIAHLRGDLRISTAIDADTIGTWADAGLRGLEVDHREHDAAARAEVSGLAARFGLVRTGGSDYHGERKPNRLGENVTDRETVDRLRAASRGGR